MTINRRRFEVKTSRIVTAIVIILVVAAGAYISLNVYMKQKASREIEKILKEKHLQNDFHYKSLSTSIFTNTVTLKNAELVLKNRQDQILGYVKFKRIDLNGDVKPEQYSFRAYQARVLTLHNGTEREIATINYVYISKSRKAGAIETTEEIKGLKLSKTVISAIKEKKKKLPAKLVKLESPINLYFNSILTPDNRTLQIKYLKLEFLDNLALSFGIKLGNLDIESLKKASGQLKRNRNSMALAGVLITTLFKVKPLKAYLSITDYGLIKRAIDLIAQENHTTREKVINNILSSLTRQIPVKSAYPALEEFLYSRKNSLKITAINKEKLSIGELLQYAKNTGKITQLIEIKFSN